MLDHLRSATAVTACGSSREARSNRSFARLHQSATSKLRRCMARSDAFSCRTGFFQPTRTMPGPTVIRKRPDSSSLPRRLRPSAHGAACSNMAAADPTISGLGNRSPRASDARSSTALRSPATSVRTFLAHITSPVAVAGLGPAPLPPTGRPLTLSRPAALRASGARDRPTSTALAESSRLRWRGFLVPEVVSRSGLSRVTDGAMLGIGVPAPWDPGADHWNEERRGFPMSGVQASCPVYVRSSDRLNASDLLSAPYLTYESS